MNQAESFKEWLKNQLSENANHEVFNDGNVIGNWCTQNADCSDDRVAECNITAQFDDGSIMDIKLELK